MYVLVATKIMQENYYSQFKFRPKIDQMSRIISEPTDLQELYMVRQFLQKIARNMLESFSILSPRCALQNEKGKRTKHALQQAAEQEFVQTCTFRPEVSKNILL